jgi:CRISPR-associated exonuclease Cas4
VHADLQLCAQALCLEEMLGEKVHKGAVYHHATRARREVHFGPDLRRQTIEAVERIRDLLERQSVPQAPNDRRCRACSLRPTCMPDVVAQPDRIRGWQGALFQALVLSDDE